jgi:hypothetical protein
MIQPVTASITWSIGNLRHGEASLGLRCWRLDSAIALGEPSIDLVLKVVDDARPAAMVRRPDAVHAPFCERRATDAKLFSGVYGSESIVSI